MKNKTYPLGGIAIIEKVEKLLVFSPKSLINLSITVVYPPNGFRFYVLSNVTPRVLAIFDDFIGCYEDKKP